MTQIDNGALAFDLFSFGEALVDLISASETSSLEEAASFGRYRGGQPSNLAANMTLLGKRSAVAACVGDDGFGRYLLKQLEDRGVATNLMQFTSRAPTSMAVITRHAGTADFLIARGADAYLQMTSDLKEAAANSRIVHTSAFGLSREPARSTILDALQIARESGRLVSLDPNYHPKIWPDTSDFKSILKSAYRFVTVSKPSLDDCIRLFGSYDDPAEYVRIFLDWGCEIVALSLGRDGVLLGSSSGDLYRVESKFVPVVDATGAGDAFSSGFLATLLDGASIVDAACMGQVVAEIKLATVGPLRQLPGTADLLMRASSINYHKL